MVPSVLVTGFTPFDGRAVNASWITAQAIVDHFEGDPITALEIPVVWGEPARLLGSLCKKNPPNIIISMGEGKEGYCALESIARNSRKQRTDNNDRLPEETRISPSAPMIRETSADLAFLCKNLTSEVLPVRISRDAGKFLCEETLFNIEALKTKYDEIKLVVFAHLPPYGSSVELLGRQQTCDESAYRRFGIQLYKAVLKLYLLEQSNLRACDASSLIDHT